MSSEQKTIIVVEDEPDTAEMFGEMMHLIGYRVLKAYGGASAIGLLSQETPHAVVLDLMMPDLSGLQVLTYIRQDERLKDVPVIIVSAKSLPTDIKVGLEAGATVYLTKPVAYLDLKEAVEQAIRSKM